MVDAGHLADVVDVIGHLASVAFGAGFALSHASMAAVTAAGVDCGRAFSRSVSATRLR